MAAPEFEDSDLHVETTTIMFADVVESVRLIEQDERRNVTHIRGLLLRLAETIVPAHHGVLLERRGDGLLVRFDDPRNAVSCAIAFHDAANVENRDRESSARVELRIGLHTGEVLTDGHALFGSQVNTAARIAALAGPNETVASEDVRDELAVGIDVEVQDLGECYFKHKEDTLRVFRVTAVDAPLTRSNSAVEAATLPVLGVLPFDVFGATSTSEHSTVVGLLAESIIHVVSRNERIAVSSWASSRQLNNSIKAVSQAAVRLDASWLLTGSVYVAGAKLLVTCELHPAQGERALWAGRYSGDIGDLLSTQSELAAQIAFEVTQQIVELELRRVDKHALPNLSSHSILTGAIGLMHRSGRERFERSRDALEHLLERHPKMHAVRPWLAQWYVLRNTRGFGTEPKRDAVFAIEQTSRALDSIAEDSRALALLGFSHFHLLGDVGAARRYLDMAVALNPNDPLAAIFCAAVKSVDRCAEDGDQLAKHALRIAPFDPLRDYMRALAAGCAMSAGNLPLAIELGEASTKENSNHPYPWRVLLIAHARLGQTVQARKALSRLSDLGIELTISSYSKRSKLSEHDLALAVSALRGVGVPEG